MRSLFGMRELSGPERSDGPTLARFLLHILTHASHLKRCARVARIKHEKVDMEPRDARCEHRRADSNVV